MNYRLYPVDLWVSGEGKERSAQHGLAPNRTELFRPFAAGARAPSRGYHYRRYARHGCKTLPELGF
jgi:hypothetical protein